MEREIERTPALLSKDRRIAAPLVEGAAERSDVYRTAQKHVREFMEALRGVAEEKMREIRRAKVGEARAAEEQEKGSKTEEEYARGG